VLALAEATSSTTETPRLTALDLDDPESPHIVRLPGSTKVRPRNGHLTDWGSRVMAMWVRDRRNSGVPDEAPLTYGGTLPETASPQASTCVAFRSIMRACGLDREQDLRPRSIIYWAGRQAFDQAETERIEAAARAMGVSSLDRAARQIDYSWDLQ